jgi:hypothetical protein
MSEHPRLNRLRSIAERVDTIVNEECGMQPVMPTEDLLTLLERHLFKQRQEIVRLGIIEEGAEQTTVLLRAYERQYTDACDILGREKFALGPEAFLPELERLRRLEAADLDDLRLTEDSGSCAECQAQPVWFCDRHSKENARIEHERTSLLAEARAARAKEEERG